MYKCCTIFVLFLCIIVTPLQVDIKCWRKLNIPKWGIQYIWPANIEQRMTGATFEVEMQFKPFQFNLKSSLNKIWTHNPPKATAWFAFHRSNRTGLYEVLTSTFHICLSFRSGYEYLSDQRQNVRVENYLFNIDCRLESVNHAALSLAVLWLICFLCIRCPQIRCNSQYRQRIRVLEVVYSFVVVDSHFLSFSRPQNYPISSHLHVTT